MSKKRIQVFHPESPDVRIWVERGFWGRLLKPKHFATLTEAVDYEIDILCGAVERPTHNGGDYE